MGPWFEVSGLKYATSNLLLDCHALEHEGLGLICCKCGNAKPVVNGAVADAGQFFEVVQPSAAVHCMANHVRCFFSDSNRICHCGP